MRAPSARLFSALGAVTLLAAAAPAQAAPFSPSTTTYKKAYSGTAATLDDSACLPDAMCQVIGKVNPVDGTYEVDAEYARGAEEAVAGGEVVKGTSLQRFNVKVPPGASKVTAVFTWQVDRGTVEAHATVGGIRARSSVGATAYCGRGCAQESVATSRTVRAATSQDGSPSLPMLYVADGQKVDVTVSAAGKLPPFVHLSGTIAGEVLAGPSALLCSASPTCVDEHAGDGSATIAATLLQVSVTIE